MSFDTLAPVYRAMEWVLAGGKLQRCRTILLPDVSDAREVLVVGEGPGRWIEAACGSLPAARFTVVDASAGMLALAEKAWGRAGGELGRIRFMQARLPGLPPRASDAVAFDLIVTPFFLDCFAPEVLEEVVRELGAVAAPRARWLVCDFRVPPEGVARARARVVLALAHGFFRWTTDISARRLTDPAPLLCDLGFAVESEITSDWGLLGATLWRRDAEGPSADCCMAETPAHSVG